MSTLSQYLKATGTTQAAFASLVGVSQAYVAKLCRGGTPSLQVALDIDRVTDGAVSPASWKQESGQQFAQIGGAQ